MPRGKCLQYCTEQVPQRQRSYRFRPVAGLSPVKFRDLRYSQERKVHIYELALYEKIPC